MFLYESIVKTDYLLKYLKDLKQFNNVNLYIGNNFKDLNDIFHNLKCILEMDQLSLYFQILNVRFHEILKIIS